MGAKFEAIKHATSTGIMWHCENNLEQGSRIQDKVRSFLNDCYNNDIQFVTSVITIEEYFVYPYRVNETKYIDLFEKLIQTLNFKIVNIDKTIAKSAAKIRAEYKAFKAMDALQIATAMLNECDLLLTNDKQLRQFKGIKCITIDDLS